MHVELLNAFIASQPSQSTRHARASAARGVLRYLAKYHGGPELECLIRKVARPKPRNVTATEEERSALLAAAPPHIKCWLLLCSDLAIRSGTAAKLGPENYDRQQGVLTFTTKYGNAQVLPVTRELRLIIDGCKDMTRSFVSQLQQPGMQRRNKGRVSRNTAGLAFRKLKERLGIRGSLRPHDLRRTTVRKVYDKTRDLRIAQALLGHSDLAATAWYLQDALTEVPLATLELAKLNPLTERPQ